MTGIMQEYGVDEACMESTSIYWMPVWRVLEPYVSLKLINPFFIRIRNKADRGHSHDTAAAEAVIYYFLPVANGVQCSPCRYFPVLAGDTVPRQR